MTIGHWIIDKLVRFIQAEDITVFVFYRNTGSEAIQEFNGMIPNAAHLAINMPSDIRKATILIAHEIHAISGGNKRRLQVLCLSFNKWELSYFRIVVTTNLFFRS